MPAGQSTSSQSSRELDEVAELMQSDLKDYIRHPGSLSSGGGGGGGAGIANGGGGSRGVSPASGGVGSYGGMLKNRATPMRGRRHGGTAAVGGGLGDFELRSMASGSESGRDGGGRGGGRGAGVIDIEAQYSSRSLGRYSIGSSEGFDVDDANQRIAPPKVGCCFLVVLLVVQ